MTHFQDLRYAARALRKSPGFTAVAALTLALGVGANTAIFSVVNTVMLRPLPFAEPDELVRIWESNVERGWPTFAVSHPNFLDFRVAGRRASSRSRRPTTPASRWTRGGEAEIVLGMQVTATFLPALKITPVLGRNFLDEEDRPGGNTRVVLISDGFWRRALGANPNVIGQSISLNAQPYTIIGVLPASFRWGTNTDMLAPLAPDPARNRADHRLSVIGRVKAGVVDRSGAHRARNHRRAARPAISRIQQGLGRARDQLLRLAGPRDDASIAAGAARRRGAGAADRLRQRRQSAARPRRRPAARAVDSRGDGRVAIASGAPAAVRIVADRDARRRRRHRHRVCGDAVAGRSRTGLGAEARRAVDRWARLRVRDRRGADDHGGVWIGAGDPGGAAGSTGRAACRRPSRHRRRRPHTHSRGADHRRSRAVGRAADRRGPVDSQLRAPAAGRAGIRGVEPDDGAREPVGHQLSHRRDETRVLRAVPHRPARTSRHRSRRNRERPAALGRLHGRRREAPGAIQRRGRFGGVAARRSRVFRNPRHPGSRP